MVGQGEGFDVFVSCCRYNFVTGKFPFEGENVYKLFAAISVGVFTMSPDISPMLQDLIKGT